jgi:hypothetical protein
MFTDLLDKVAPFKEIRLKNQTEPWIDSNNLDLLHRREKAYARYRKSHNNYDKILFNKLRNEVQRSIKLAKSEYFKGQI